MSNKINPRCIGHIDDFKTIGHDSQRTSEQIKKDSEFMQSIENLPDSYFEKLKEKNNGKR